MQFSVGYSEIKHNINLQHVLSQHIPAVSHFSDSIINATTHKNWV